MLAFCWLSMTERRYPWWVLQLAGVGVWLARRGPRGYANAWFRLWAPLILIGCRGRRP